MNPSVRMTSGLQIQRSAPTAHKARDNEEAVGVGFWESARDSGNLADICRRYPTDEFVALPKAPLENVQKVVADASSAASVSETPSR